MRRWVIGGTVWALVACAGAAPPAPTAGSASRSGAPILDLVADAPRSGSPSGLPSDAPIWIRLASPARDLPLITSYGVLERDVAVTLENPELVLATLVGQELAEAIDLDAPVDFLFGDRPGDELLVTIAFR